MRPVLVTTRQYRDVLDVGDPVSQAKIYEAQLADELVVLNIDGTPHWRDEPLLALIERLATETFMPLTVGGGVREIDDFALLLERGADKVCINAAGVPATRNSSARRRPGMARNAWSSRSISGPMRRGAQSRIPAMPACRSTWMSWNGRVRAAEAGAGEILLTDARSRRHGIGLNCHCGRAVADAVSIPVILSGGCGLAEHFVEGFSDGGR